MHLFAPSGSEGAGKAGRRLRPQSAVCKSVEKNAHGFGRYSRDIPAFPAQWFYGLYVLSPVSGVCCHRRQRDASRQLDATVAAPGPHDFAVRCGVFVWHASMPDAATSIATRATFRDDRANVPHGGAGWVKDNSDLRNSQEDILDFRNISLSSFGARARGAPARHERDARCRAARHLCNCTNLGHGTRV
jgi:hypothetical protein